MIQDVTLPAVFEIASECRWLEQELLGWLDQEFLAEPLHAKVATRATQIYARQRLEGENLVMAIHIALLAELRHFNFGNTALSEFVIANAVADLLLSHFGEEA
jgi:hypothetical protein